MKQSVGSWKSTACLDIAVLKPKVHTQQYKIVQVSKVERCGKSPARTFIEIETILQNPMKVFCAHGYTILMYRNFYLGHISVLVYKLIVLLSCLAELERQCPGGCPDVMYIVETYSLFSDTPTRICTNETEAVG